MEYKLKDLMNKLPDGTETRNYENGNRDRRMPLQIIIYHANCLDGFGAAWAIHRALTSSHYPLVGLYIPAQYENRDEIVEALSTYEFDRLPSLHIVDFSFTSKQFERLSQITKSVVYLDHHAGAEDNLIAARDICDTWDIEYTIKFGSDRSGCGLAVEHYLCHETAPRILAYIQDRDLWKFRLARTKSIVAAIQSYEMDFDVWDKLPDTDILHHVGEHILRANKLIVESIASRDAIKRCSFRGNTAAVVECHPRFASDVGNYLLDSHAGTDIAMMRYTNMNTGEIRWSLRSREHGVNLIPLLSPLGGGGHMTAAGIVFDSTTAKFYREFMAGFDV